MEGPIECDEIVLKSNANVIGDIACESVMIEKGAFMESRLMRRTNGHVRQALRRSRPACSPASVTHTGKAGFRP